MANIITNHRKQITNDCVLLEVQLIRCQQPLESTEGALATELVMGCVSRISASQAKT